MKWSPHNWVVVHPLYTLNNQGVFHCLNIHTLSCQESFQGTNKSDQTGNRTIWIDVSRCAVSAKGCRSKQSSFHCNMRKKKRWYDNNLLLLRCMKINKCFLCLPNAWWDRSHPIERIWTNSENPKRENVMSIPTTWGPNSQKESQGQLVGWTNPFEKICAFVKLDHFSSFHRNLQRGYFPHILRAPKASCFKVFGVQR